MDPNPEEITIKECIKWLQALKECAPKNYQAAAFTIYVHYSGAKRKGWLAHSSTRPNQQSDRIIDIHSYFEDSESTISD